MELKDFKELITTYDSSVKYLESVADLGIDLYETNLASSNDYMFDKVLGANFNDDIIDLIYWWLFEDVEKVIFDNDKEISVRSIEELYNYITSKNES